MELPASLSVDISAGGADWQAVKTTGFSAVVGEGYFCNTTSAAFTATLPAYSSNRRFYCIYRLRRNF
jgi:hypothetical protein